MKFKGLVLALCFVAITFSSWSQFRFIRNQTLDEIKRTIFVYRDSDKDDTTNLKIALSRAWNHDTLILMNYREYKDYEKRKTLPGDLVFLMEAYFWKKSVTTNISGPPSSNPNRPTKEYEYTRPVQMANFYLSAFHYNQYNNANLVARTNLFVDDSIRVIAAETEFNAENTVEAMYSRGELFNWHYPFLSTFMSAYLQYLQNNNSKQSAYSYGLKELKTNKLYISDEVNKSITKMARIKVRNRSSQITRTYAFNSEVVSLEELNELNFENSPQYVLLYIMDDEYRYTVVVELTTFRILYNRSGRKKKFDFETKDVKLLKKAILASE